jgi:hypothetical protein
VAAIKTTANVVGQFRSLVGRKVGVGVKVVDPVQGTSAACSPGGEMLGHPKRCPGQPGVEQRELRVTDLTGVRRKLGIGESRSRSTEEVLRASCRRGVGGDEKHQQNKGRKGVGQSHSGLIRRASLDRSIAGPFHTSKAHFLKSMLSPFLCPAGVFRLETGIRRSP